jgi:hypothetical protein
LARWLKHGINDSERRAIDADVRKTVEGAIAHVEAQGDLATAKINTCPRGLHRLAVGGWRNANGMAATISPLPTKRRSGNPANRSIRAKYRLGNARNRRCRGSVRVASLVGT